MRAFFAEGVDRMRISWAVEGLPMLLHLSLFLFFWGLAIFLFKMDHEVFSYVISWIGLFFLVYGFITLLPIFRHDSPYHSPLSTPAWFLYSSIHHATFKIFAFINRRDFRSPWNHRAYRSRQRYLRLKDRYRRWVLGGVEKAAEETASERSSEIDFQILDWIISAVGDDDSLKSFFEAIPGFFSSKLVVHFERHFPVQLVKNFTDALDGFLIRTWSSNSVDDSEKDRRLDISLKAINQISRTPHRPHQFILHDILFRLRDELPRTVEMGHTLVRWFKNNDQDIPADVQRIVAGILLSVRERDDNWVKLAARVFGLQERDLQDKVTLGDDSVILAILIHVTRQYIGADNSKWIVLEALSKLDIRNTLPRLQHDFCTFWNEMVQNARDRDRGSYTTAYILRGIRRPYIALHQGTDAVPTAFSAYYSDTLFEPSSYPLCDPASHHHRLDSTPQDSTPHVFVPFPTPTLFPPLTHGTNVTSRQTEHVTSVITPPSTFSPTSTSEIGVTSRGDDTNPPANPIRSSSCPTGTSPIAVAATAPQDIVPTATFSRPLEGREQQYSDTVAPIPTFLPNSPSKYYDAGVASISNSLHLAPPSIRSPIPASRPIGSATLPRVRVRGLVNSRNISFANAVLQLLVNSPPSWNLFRALGDLKGQRGAGVSETGGGATPLVDAMVELFKEFVVEEELPSTQQRSQPATGTSRAEEEKNHNSFEPTYMYDVMKEKVQLKPLLVRFRALVTASYY